MGRRGQGRADLQASGVMNTGDFDSAPVLRALQLFWLMLPAYAANMAPPFTRFWHGWNQPIHARLLGVHKTVVGFAAGVLVALLIAGTQALIDWPHDPARGLAAWWQLGLAAGCGAMGGDSLKSLFKRRLGIAPGARWIPFDQLDFVIGALILLAFLVPLSLVDIAAICLFSFVADIAVNQIAFLLRIRTTRW